MFEKTLTFFVQGILFSVILVYFYLYKNKKTDNA